MLNTIRKALRETYSTTTINYSETIVSEAYYFATQCGFVIPEEGFIQYTKEVFEEHIDAAFTLSQFLSEEARGKDELSITIEKTDDMEMLSDVRMESPDSITIFVSLGFFISLYDISMRALSSEACLNPYIFKEGIWSPERRWENQRCVMPYPDHHPRCRYINYGDLIPNPVYEEFCRDVELQQGLEAGSLKGSYIGRFFKKMPLDSNRHSLADRLVQIALTYILLHEEHHHREGHLQYDEFLSGFDQELEAKAFRAFELFADRGAFIGVFDVFYGDGFLDIPQMVNPLFPEGDNGQLEFVLTALGLVCILQRLNGIENDDDQNYPSPRTRLGMAFKAALVAKNEKFNVKPDFRRYYSIFKLELPQKELMMVFHQLVLTAQSIQGVLLLLNEEGFSIELLYPDTELDYLYATVMVFELLFGGDNLDDPELDNEPYKETILELEEGFIPSANKNSEYHEIYLDVKEYFSGYWSELHDLIDFHDSDNFEKLLKFSSHPLANKR